jgi:phage terminase large subunit-like protein
VTGNSTALQRQAAAGLKGKRKRSLPWERKGLSRVERVIAFLEFLPITKGILIGKKLQLLPNQRRFIERIYGATDVRIAVRSEPRGNGKTGLVSGLALCHLLGPEAEERGECYSAAVNRLQSSLMHGEMSAIIERVPEFAAVVNIRRGGQRRCIEVISGPGIGSVYEALSADARRGHGLAPSWWAYDELAQTRDRRLLDALTTGMGKRKRALGIVLSTQAEDDEHPLSQLIDDGLAGVDPSIVVDLTAAPVDADVFDEDVIRACNPAFGIFLDAGTLLKEARQARRLPSSESAFRNLRCNQRISAAPDLLVTPSVWALGNDPIDEKIFRDGRPVYAGLDLSARLDLTAMVLAAEDNAGIVHLKPLAWTPGRTVATREMRDAAPYAAWINGGALRSTPGLAIDYDYVVGDIAAAIEGMNLVAVAFDTWNSNALRQACERTGVTLPLEPFIQGYKSYTPAISAFEVECTEGRIRHGAHPVLRWCIANTMLVRGPAGTPQQNRKPEKRRGNGRIDLAVAALMAIGALKVTTPAPEYDIAALIG